MDFLNHLVSEINSVLWGVFCLIPLLCGTGIFYSIKLRFVQVRKFGLATRLLFGGATLFGKRADKTGMSSFQALATANLLGLGNAATPLGIRAARRMARGTDGTADDELCRLVVLNTASLQLLPTTVAGVRAACGCRTPFDILPAVWLSSAISVTAGLLAARLLQRVWRD